LLRFFYELARVECVKPGRGFRSPMGMKSDWGAVETNSYLLIGKFSKTVTAGPICRGNLSGDPPNRISIFRPFGSKGGTRGLYLLAINTEVNTSNKYYSDAISIKY
jgi:hypothetical protein